MKKILFCLICLISIFYPISLLQAEQFQTSQIELATAKGCLLYDCGKLNDALKEFQYILSKDPLNQAALDYIKKIEARKRDAGISQWDLSEEVTGYKNALLAKKKIVITDQERYTYTGEFAPFERFINNTSVGYNDRHIDGANDISFSPDGFFIEEHMRLDANVNNWQNAVLMDARYHDNSHEDARLRKLTYAASNPAAGIRFIAGDTSTVLSRYTLRGMYYRGVNLTLNSGPNEFKVLWGAAPHFLTKTSDSQNIDAETYIHPRKVFGVRDAYKVMDGYKVGVSFMELRDSERVRVIDANYNPKLNRVFAIDQTIDAVPSIWKIETENAYSTSDEDRTDKDILVLDDKLKDTAHYIRSAIEVPKFRLINSFERIGPDFRSYSDLASTTTTWLSGITSDREKIYNYLEYRPFEDDPIYLDMNFSRVRNNLDDDNNVEMNQQTDYGAGLRYMPYDCRWFPQSSVRLKFTNTLGVPGSLYTSNDLNDRDIIFELAKKLYGVDLNASYTNRKTLENIDTFATYTNIYGIRFAKELTDMVLLSGDYSHSDSVKNQDCNDYKTGGEDSFNINTALRLWAGANLSFGYGYEDAVDVTGITGDTKINTYIASFSWPFTKYFTRSGSELILAPYITYQLANGLASGAQDRSILALAADASYIISNGHRLSLNASYREDQGENVIGTGTEDYRLLLTYQKIFQ